MASVGWFANDTPLHLGRGRRFGSAWWRRRGQLMLSTEQRVRHMYVVGSSGSGKTRFLRHLVCQDVDANRGFTLVDPHGDLHREVLTYICELALGPGEPTPERIAQLGDKLVILEPSDQRFGAPGINLLQVGPGQHAYSRVDAIIAVIHELWSDSYGPRMEDMMRNGLLLLQEQGLTLLEMLPLLTDRDFRNVLVNRCRNEEARLYFEQHLGELRPGELKTWVESSRNKLNAFLASPFIRPILGQASSTLNFRRIIDNGQWLLVNVSRDSLKESRRLLGALIVSLLHEAAISREQVGAERRTFHCLWVDEFEEFYTPSFVHILEGGRKYGLGLALFHQNLTQPPFDRDPAIIDTIFSNTHSQIAFNVSRKDAERLAGELFSPTGTEIKYQRRFLGIPLEERPQLWSMPEEREYHETELMAQRFAEAYVKFKGVADDEPYALSVPNVPDIRPNREKMDLLREHVARRYYRPLADIEREIHQRWEAIRSAGIDTMRERRDYRQ